MSSRTSEPLVPNDLPQGERQNIVAAMKAGGVPLAPGAPTQPGLGGLPAPPGGAVPQAGAPLTGPDLLTERTPADFPFLTDPTARPSTPPADPDSTMSALTESSQSSFGAAVLARLAATRGR